MFCFTPAAYGPTVASLLSADRLNALGPGSPNLDLHPQLKSLTPEGLGKVDDAEMADCCIAGLWLWHDFLDESHSISQHISSPSGSYWHGIMHRREPDYSNSKYWYRRAGEHAIFPALLEFAAELSEQEHVAEAVSLVRGDSWDPYAFVDLCQSATGGRGDASNYCRRVARHEWQLLFDYCFQRALRK